MAATLLAAISATHASNDRRAGPDVIPPHRSAVELPGPAGLRRWVRGHLFPLADPAYRLSDREDRRGQAHRLRRPLRPEPWPSLTRKRPAATSGQSMGAAELSGVRAESAKRAPSCESAWQNFIAGPRRHLVLANKFRTLDTCHCPPRRVRMPRSVSASAIPRRLVAPPIRMSATTCARSPA